MNTELLFRDDAYLKTATARVTAVHERGIELDRTKFSNSIVNALELNPVIGR